VRCVKENVGIAKGGRMMSYILVHFQPGDHGEWERIDKIIGPFKTEKQAEDYYQSLPKSPWVPRNHTIHTADYSVIHEMEAP
jgi:hypothetical protein